MSFVVVSLYHQQVPLGDIGLTLRRQKNQHDKFVEKARELGCDEDENRFYATLKKIARHEPQKKNGKQTNPDEFIAIRDRELK